MQTGTRNPPIPPRITFRVLLVNFSHFGIFQWIPAEIEVLARMKLAFFFFSFFHFLFLHHKRELQINFKFFIFYFLFLHHKRELQINFKFFIFYFLFLHHKRELQIKSATKSFQREKKKKSSSFGWSNPFEIGLLHFYNL